MDCLNIIKKIQRKLHNSDKRRDLLMGTGSKLYPESRIINMQIPEKIQIGENTHIRGSLLTYPYGEGIKIGNNSYIGENSIIRAAHKIVVGNSVLIAHNVNIIDTDSHELDYKERDESFRRMLKEGHPKTRGHVETAPIIIEDHVWISYNVCILKGVKIGWGAIIGCGSVVTHDIPPLCLAVGNPAKVVKVLNQK